MLLSDSQVNERLNSLDNLINSLSGLDRLESHQIIPARDNKEIEIPTLPPNIENLVDDLETKLRTAKINESALDIIDMSLEQLKMRLCEVEKPENLSRIASDMSKIVSGNRKPEDESNGKTQNQVIIYRPTV